MAIETFTTPGYDVDASINLTIRPSEPDPVIEMEEEPKEKSYAFARIMAIIMAVLPLWILLLFPFKALTAGANDTIAVQDYNVFSLLKELFSATFSGQMLFGALPILAPETNVFGKASGIFFYLVVLSIPVCFLFSLIAAIWKNTTHKLFRFILFVEFFVFFGYFLTLFLACTFYGLSDFLDLPCVAVIALSLFGYFLLSIKKAGKRAWMGLLLFLLTVACGVLALNALMSQGEALTALFAEKKLYKTLAIVLCALYALFIARAFRSMSAPKVRRIDFACAWVLFYLGLRLAVFALLEKAFSGLMTLALVSAAIALVMIWFERIALKKQKKLAEENTPLLVSLELKRRARKEKEAKLESLNKKRAKKAKKLAKKQAKKAKKQAKKDKKRAKKQAKKDKKLAKKLAKKNKKLAKKQAKKDKKLAKKQAKKDKKLAKKNKKRAKKQAKKDKKLAKKQAKKDKKLDKRRRKLSKKPKKLKKFEAKLAKKQAKKDKKQAKKDKKRAKKQAKKDKKLAKKQAKKDKKLAKKQAKKDKKLAKKQAKKDKKLAKKNKKLAKKQAKKAKKLAAGKRYGFFYRISALIVAAIPVAIFYVMEMVVSAADGSKSIKLLDAITELFAADFAGTKLFGALPTYAGTDLLGKISTVLFYAIPASLAVCVLLALFSIIAPKKLGKRVKAMLGIEFFVCAAYLLFSLLSIAITGATAPLDLACLLVVAFTLVLYLILSGAKPEARTFRGLVLFILTVASAGAVVFALATNSESLSELYVANKNLQTITIIVIAFYAFAVTCAFSLISASKIRRIDLVCPWILFYLGTRVAVAAFLRDAYKEFLVFGAVSAVAALLVILMECKTLKRQKEAEALEVLKKELSIEPIVEAVETEEVIVPETNIVVAPPVALVPVATPAEAPAAKASEEVASAADDADLYGVAFDAFLGTLTFEERTQFIYAFMVNKPAGLPTYQPGEDNSVFFRKFFINLGSLRASVSDSLMEKIYQYTVTINK